MTGLGEIIQAKRKELGLTQERLAEKIGKTAGYIGQIERGLSYPSYPVLLQLIETLELDVQSLFCTCKTEARIRTTLFQTLKETATISPWNVKTYFEM